ncbi:hypothetical protein QBC38DRAFT_488869 [Podospora fimiseda]|uniref:Uncharacterized protein n=1 Tax=Podospora fimiseda TaxID=252190 RepID=A0AAN7BGC2_9PEZI|nr:hypothetical protein QBC38DRAFT_488869 [Podospora fimiseda]
MWFQHACLKVKRPFENQILTSTQFHFLFDNNTLVKTFSCSSVQKTPICQEYDYKCSQSTDIDIHMRIMAEIILHDIRSPDLGKGQKTVLDGVPKRNAPPELPKKAKEFSWGFHTGQGPCLRKVISCSGDIIHGRCFRVYLAGVHQ